MTQILNSEDRLLTIGEVARRLATTEGNLRTLRYRGEGPPAIRISRRTIRYRESDVIHYLEQLNPELTAQSVPSKRVAS